MIDAKTKNRFIELRAAGLSYNKITKELHISRSTCQKLVAELTQEIDEEKQAEIKTLAETYHMTRAARIRTTGEILKKLDAAIDAADFSDVPADRLLSIRLQYTEAMQRELVIPREKVKAATAGEILSAYTELLNEVRAGNLTNEQAQKEASILSGMLKAFEGVELKQKIEEIEKMLSSD